MRACLLCMIATLPGAALAQSPAFENRSDTLPMAHEYLGPWEHFVGGGVAVMDCNGDAYPDFLAAGGTEPARLFVNAVSAPGGDLAFDAADTIPKVTGVTGAYPLDIDSDGTPDLVILRAGANQIWRGEGDCVFSDATADYDLQSGEDWSTGFSATWEAGAEFPTLAFGNYVDRDDPEGPFGACSPNRLHRPEGGKFSNIVDLEPGHCSLSVLFSDWQRRGVQDLRISNDRHYHADKGQEQMWRMPDVTLMNEEDGWERLVIWGMGIASEDINGDGLPDALLTSMGDQVLQLSGESGLKNASYDVGITAQLPHVGGDTGMTTGWHAEFGDVNNDGYSDLFIAKGNVDDMEGAAVRDPNNLLMQKPDTTFYEAAADAGVASFERSRGASLADFNRDGLLDLVVNNRRAPIDLYQNVSIDTGNWIAVQPQQGGTNRHAIGAWVEIKDSNGIVRPKEVTVGGGHAGGRLGPLHFGLGDADAAEIRVIWPDGSASDWAQIPAGQLVTVSRADGAALMVDQLP